LIYVLAVFTRNRKRLDDEYSVMVRCNRSSS